MKVYQSRTLDNRIKKFSRQEKDILDNEIKAIIENPLIEKKRKATSEARSFTSSRFGPPRTYFLTG